MVFSAIKGVFYPEWRESQMIKCVISDLGKVVLFFDNHVFFRKMAGYCSLSEADISSRVHKDWKMIQAFDSGKLSPEEFYNEAVRRLQAKIDRSTFYNIYNDVFSLNPPVLDILRNLKSRYTLVLLSNTDVERFGFIREKFPEIFIFDEYVLSYEVGNMKPHPQIYKTAHEKADAKPEECVFIDDMEQNTKGAEDVGINTILYGPDTDLAGELKRFGLSF